MTLIGAIRVSLQGNEDVGGRVGTEIGGKNADYCVRIATEDDRFSDQ